MSLPLVGLNILVTRAKKQASDLADRLTALGAHPIVLPSIEIVPPSDEIPLCAAMAEIETFDWIVFTSTNSVRSVLGRGLLGRAKVAAVGTATAAEFTRGGRVADVIPASFMGDALPDALGDVRGMRIFFPHGDLARPNLVASLRERGADVVEVEAYRTIAAAWDAEAIRTPDLITFTSSSGVLATHERLAERGLLGWLETKPIVCIGPVTADTVRCLGLEPAAVASEYTIPGLVQAVVSLVEAKHV